MMTLREILQHKRCWWAAAAIFAGLVLSITALSEVLAHNAENTDGAPAQTQTDGDQNDDPASPDTPATPSDPNEPPQGAEPDAITDQQQPQEEPDGFDSMFPDAEDIVELFDYFDRIFSDEYVSKTGDVDYATLRRKRIDLIRAANVLEQLHPAVLMSLDREQRIAFWINTYNACTLKLIIDNYPIEPKWYMIFYPGNSIMQIPGAWTRVFFRIMGLEYNLQEMRNDLLLDRYQDPRISFALTHAARGGALLRNEPFVPETLDEQLDDQVRRFLASQHGMRIDTGNNVLYLSNVFSMNRNAFINSEYAEILRFRSRRPEERAWLNFLYEHLPEEQASWLLTNDPAIRLMDFDWTLNEQ